MLAWALSKFGINYWDQNKLQLAIYATEDGNTAMNIEQLAKYS